MNRKETFARRLLSWYSSSRRALPWRETGDPYRVWLSEIILQQTRVAQGLPYYERFTKAFPTVQVLAAANEQEVLRLWQGLGYYSRARNLHAAARRIVAEYGGVFPADHASIRSLEGVGEYTAAAIASICFGVPEPVVDGNVIRFLSRLHGVEEPAGSAGCRNRIRAIAAETIDRERPGDFNQAMMEFGALVCTPASPDCGACPFAAECVARRTNRVAMLPVVSPKAAVRELRLHYLAMTFRKEGEQRILLRKRSGPGFWRNLYDLPCIESTPTGEMPVLVARDFRELAGAEKGFVRDVTGPVTHLLSHRRLVIRFYLMEIDAPQTHPWTEASAATLDRYPFPRPVADWLDRHFFSTFAG